MIAGDNYIICRITTMSRAGLSFASTMFSNPEDAYAVTTSANTPLNPAASMGSDALQRTTTDMAIMGQQARAMSQFEMPGLATPAKVDGPVQPQEPQIFFDVRSKRLSVNGMVVDADDYTGLAQTTQALKQPARPPQEEGDWRPVPLAAYEQIIQGIMEPGRGRLFAQNFASGVDSLKQLGGSALQLAGAEELGGRIVDRAEANMARREVFTRDVTEVSDLGEGVDWFVSVLGQQGPMILESIAAAVAGGVVGTKMAGPGVGTAGGAIAGLFGRKAFKESVIKAAEKARAGKALTIDERNLLSSASAVAGATIATVANNYAIGAGDIYGEMRDQGVGPDDSEARLLALAGAVPYAALSSIPDFIAAGKVFGFMNRPPLPVGATRTQRGTELLKRVGGGAAVLGTAEGVTELGQEALVLGLSGQDLSSDKSVNRLINALAAGVAVGGTIGGLASLRSGDPVNLVKPGDAADQAALAASAAPPPTPPAGATSTDEPINLLPAPTAQTGVVPPTAPTGTQGVLDVSVPGQPMTAQEVTARQQITPEQPAIQLPMQPIADDRQGALQFGQPAPEGVGFTQQPTNPILAIQMRRAQETAAQQQREAQRPVEQDAVRVLGANQMEAQRRLQELEAQLAQSSQAQVTPAAQAIQPTAPVTEQMPLFAPRETPRPTRAEMLRAGVRRDDDLLTVPAITQEPTPVDTQMDLPGMAPAVTEERARLAWDERRPNNIKRWENLTPQQKARWGEFIGAGQATPLARAQISRAGSKGIPTELPEILTPQERDRLIEGLTQPTAVVEETADAAPKPTQPKAKKAAPKKAAALKRGKQAAKALTQDEIVEQAPAIATPTPVTPTPVSEAQAKADSDAVRELVLAREAEARLARGEDIVNAQEAIAVIETTRNPDVYDEAVTTLVNLAMDTSSNSSNIRARNYINDNLTGDPTFVERFTEELAFSEAGKTEALITKGKSKGAERFTYTMAKRLGIAGRFIDRFKNIPEADMAVFRPDATLTDEGTIVDATKPAKQMTENPALRVANEIQRINGLMNARNARQAKADAEKLESMYAALTEEQRGFGTELLKGTDTPALVSDFFTEDGKLRQHPTTRKPTFTRTTREDTQRDKQLTQEAMAAIEDDATYFSDSTLEAFNNMVFDDGRLDEGSPWSGFSLLKNGQPIKKAMAPGRIRIAVKAFVSKLKVKPKVYVYRNQQDMAQKAPGLYQKAVASRPQGDFETAPAVGFAFGDGTVIIFSDRVATEQQLKFVLAHETLGHFGFRGLMSEADLNRVLDSVYDADPAVKMAVDAAVEARKMSRREATEEYLADYAGLLDTNLLARFWNSIKNALNKIGVTFDDDIARYVVSQSRAYVRQGKGRGHFFENAAVAKRIYDVEHGQAEFAPGRFAMSYGNVLRDNQVAANAAQMGRDTFDKAQNFLRNMAAKGVNVKDTMQRVLNEAATMTYLANENRGYGQLYGLVRSMTQRAVALRTEFNVALRELVEPGVEAFGVKMTKGMSKEQVERTVRMANITSIIKGSQINETQLRKMDNIIDFVDGEPVVNEGVVKKLKEMGSISLEDFRDGFTYTVSEVRVLDDEGRQVLEKRLAAALKAAKTDEERTAAQAEYDTDMADGVYTVRAERKFEGFPELTEDSPEWRNYQAIRKTMDDAAIKLLRANFASARVERTDLYETAAAAIGRELTDSDKAFLNQMADKFITIRMEGAVVNKDGMYEAVPEATDRAAEFVKTVNEALLGKDTDRHQLVADFFDAVEQQKVLDDIAAFKRDSKYKDAKHQARFAIQKALQEISMFDLSRADAQMFAKQSIAGGYVPLGREGRFQVRVQAIDPETKEVYVLSERFKNQMVYMMTDGEGTANNMAQDINKVLNESGKTFQVEVMVDGQPQIREVKLEARSEVAPIGGAEINTVNLNEVAHTLVKFGINLTPQERERLIVGLTQQNANARKRLRRENTPGYEEGTMKFISRHLESIASTISRKEYKPQIDRLFLDTPRNNALWFGSQAEYNAIKQRYEDLLNDPAATRDEVKQAEIDFDRYHMSYVTYDSQRRGNDYKNQANRLLSFMEAQKSLEFTDFSSGELGSQLRFWTVIAQLGGTVAQGVLNMVAITTNVMPFLASYNRKRAFGGGFGLPKSSMAIIKAFADVGAPKYSDLAYWQELKSNPDAITASGLTQAEVDFMYRETADGTFQAAQVNSMLGSARGDITSAAGQKATRAWMYIFTETEQSSRRGAGLAAFRLQYERAMQSMERRTDLTAEERQALAYESAREFALTTVDSTLGEYSMFNRPAFFRGDLRQFMFMYMMFPLTSVMLMRNLSRAGKVGMIGMLMLLSGLKGLPFAEDIMDLVDTIAQMLGLGPRGMWKGSAERSMAEAIDAIAPGMTPYVMRGVINQITSANGADRFSLGNIAPGTGMALAGSNTASELMEVFGPVAGFIDGMIGSLRGVINYGAQVAGIAPGDTSMASLIRNSPFTAGRVVGDMLAYHDTGAIVGLNGYVISRDLTANTYIARALGFYPSAAVAENDIVRMSRRINDYTAEITAGFRAEYIAARMSNDPMRAQEVVQRVNQWNEAAKGSGMEIRNFVVNANRALREAERTTTDRYIRSTPVASRQFTEDMMRIYGLSD